MAWTNLTFAFGSVLTSAKMTQLDDNLDAMAAGDSGAPTIDRDGLSAASVVQSKFSTSTGSTSGSTASNGRTSIGLNPYCFFPMVHQASGYYANMAGHTADGNNPDLPRMGFSNNSSTDTVSYDVDWRYVLTT